MKQRPKVMVSTKHNEKTAVFPLSDKQRKFLEKMQSTYPFSMLDVTIPIILKDGYYDDHDQRTITRAIKTWQYEQRSRI